MRSSVNLKVAGHLIDHLLIMIKLIIPSIILISISLVRPAYCQNSAPGDSIKIKISETFFAKPGAYYLDSVEIDFNKTYLDPGNIKEIYEFKAPNSTGPGAILITRYSPVKLGTFGEIHVKPDNSRRVIYKYSIDDVEIKDTSNFKMEATAFKKMDIIRTTPSNDRREPERFTIALITKARSETKKKKKTDR